MARRIKKMRAMPIPMPAFTPVERPIVFEPEDVGELVGKGRGVMDTVRVRARIEVVEVVEEGESGEVRGELKDTGEEEEELEGFGTEDDWFGTGEEMEGEGDGEPKG
jgi:hypothetical protein